VEDVFIFRMRRNNEGVIDDENGDMTVIPAHTTSQHTTTDSSCFSVFLGTSAYFRFLCASLNWSFSQF